ncbi:hypothetical protein RINTHM_12370 [Richelia intracellularis HM01]|nr:hypothetical protein RINTHM_12370 [Richelia intracellularis HM01]
MLDADCNCDSKDKQKAKCKKLLALVMDFQLFSDISNRRRNF